MSGGITISRPMPWTTTRYMVVRKYGLLVRKRGLKGADNGRVNNLTSTCAHPQCFDGRLSHCSALRKSFKTVSFRLSATSSVSPVRPQNRPGPLSEPKFRFPFGSPKSAVFGFKTHPGLVASFPTLTFHTVLQRHV